jgi:cyclopropane fatty-acyl-phospholipid synthase-like methyltransferase
VIRKPSKFAVLTRLEQLAGANPQARILDLGSGLSLNFRDLLARFPEVQYTGIEPNPKIADRARESFRRHPNVKIITGFAEAVAKLQDGYYDLVVSLSVLEHVKYLEDFLLMSARKLKPGGNLVHLYDLGHSLYPSSLKERIQVWLCNNSFFSKIIPRHRFAAYVSSKMVSKALEGEGLVVDQVTYHNTPSLVSALKRMNDVEAQRLMPVITELEAKMANCLEGEKMLERMLPAVAIWAHKLKK